MTASTKKTASKPRGRKPAPRPASDLHALLLAEHGDAIRPFLHRDRAELVTVRQAAHGDGFPALTAAWERRARRTMRNMEAAHQDAVIASTRAEQDAKRAAWESRMADRWQAGDAEFFALLAVVRGTATEDSGAMKRAALLFIRHATEGGLTPSDNGFLRWLKRTERADVANIARAHGKRFPIIHREAARRALAWAMG
jgi:hypothetical protein